MSIINFASKEYEIDSKGFLVKPEQWDEDFARGMAPRLKILDGLTQEHWDVINHIRETFTRTGHCPVVYDVCRSLEFRLKDLQKLFPSGYLRGACKLAGVTLFDGSAPGPPRPRLPRDRASVPGRKIYTVDVCGFLADPGDWDEQWAAHRALETRIPDGRLTEQHWQIIHYLRRYYRRFKEVPTVFQVCLDNKLELEDLERLFPDGYHRGVVKLAGLRGR